MKTDRNIGFLQNAQVDCFAYRYFGVHRDTRKYYFRVWAPNAKEVYLISDLTGWDDGLAMEKIDGSGVWEARLYTCKGLKNEKIYSGVEGMRYRYKIVSESGVHSKCDPYSFVTDLHFQASSVVYTRSTFRFSDGKWLNKRQALSECGGRYSTPLNIYYLHLGSFLKKDCLYDSDSCYFNFKDIGENLIPYVKQMGYTHVCLMPVTEYRDFDPSGRTVFSPYSLSSRFGSPDDFKFFVNKLHNNGIGVILDWVFGDFDNGEFGLSWFDGSHLYERDEINTRGSNVSRYDFTKKRVCSYLISNAFYWLNEFHLDGLNFHSTASVLRENYPVDNDWTQNKYGVYESIEGIEFVKYINYLIKKEFKGVITICDDPDILYPLTQDVRADGLGFSFTLNSKWTEGALEYISADPFYRSQIHDKLTMSDMNLFNERSILGLTPSLVTSGRESIINRAFGDYLQKFANLRAFYVLMMTFPGKKINFMGCEFGQFKECDFTNRVEWFLLDFDMHQKLQRFTADLNHRYLNDTRLYSDDYSYSGFRWVYRDMADKNVVVYKRFNKKGEEVIVVLNFAGVQWHNFLIPVSGDNTSYRIVINSQSAEYGGEYDISSSCSTIVSDYQRYIAFDSLPSLCGLIIEPVPPTSSSNSLQ